MNYFIQVAEAEYDLILQNDINSKGNTQWFNFTVEINEEKTYKFNIVNLVLRMLFRPNQVLSIKRV